MPPSPRLLAILAFLVLTATCAFSQRAPDWEQLATEARALAAESSWSLAIERFESALAAAPKDRDLRPLQLELNRARLQEVKDRREWDERRAGAEALTDALRDLIPTYDPEAAGAPISDFELEVLATLVETGRLTNSGEAMHVLRQVAFRLGQQPASSANTARLATFLRPLLADQHFSRNDFAEFPPLLRAIRDRAPDPENRAWAAYQLALHAFAPTVSADWIQAWQTARELARNTALSATVDAAWFLWKVDVGWKPESELGAPADFAELITEAKALHARLEHSIVAEHRTNHLRSLTRYLDTWQEPQLRLESDLHFLPDEPIAFSFSTARLETVEFELVRVAVSPAFADWNLHKRDDYAATGETVGRWTRSIETKSEFDWHSEVHEFSPRPAPGCYVLFAQGRPTDGAPVLSKRVRFTVGAYRAHCILPSLHDGPAELVLTDARSHQPVAGVRVRGMTRDRHDHVREWTLTTDARGRATGVLFPTTDFEEYDHLSMIGEADGHAFQIQPHYTHFADNLVADLVLDRPLYRPGETLHWKLILRERIEGKWRVPEHRVSLEVNDSEAETLFTLTNQPLDPFGSLDGAIELPEDVGIGELSVWLELSNGRSVEVPALCAVENYVPPALTASISYPGDADGLRPHREIPIRVSAHYLSGGPAVGAQVSLRITPLHRPDQTVATLEGTTDSTGQVDLLWSAAAFDQLVLYADVLPLGGQPVNASALWRLSPTGLFATIDDTNAPLLVQTEQPVQFTGHVENGTGTPSTLRGQAKLVRLHWRGFYLNPEGEVVDNRTLPAEVDAHDLPEGWRRLQEGYNETETAVTDLLADEQGHFTISFPAPSPGLYRVHLVDAHGTRLSAPNPNNLPTWDPGIGRLPSTDRYDLVVVNPDTTSLPIPPHQDRVFVPAGIPETSSPQAVVVRGKPDQTLLLTLSRETTTQSQVLPAGAAITAIDLSATARTPGRGQLTLSTLDGEVKAIARFEVTAAAEPFAVEVTSPTTARPGETIEVAIRTRNEANEPAPAQVLHMVADEAVLQLARGLAPGGGDPLEPAFASTAPFVGARVLTSVAPTFAARHPLEDSRPGAIVRATTTAVPRYEQGFDYSISLSPFSVSAESGGYMASRTLAGNRLNTELRDIGNAVSVVTSQFLQDIAATDSEELVGYTASTEVGGVQGNFGEARPAPIRLRRHFASTAAWFPALLTDAEGRAEVAFTLPDNLTSWRHTTYALSADGLSASTTHTTLRTTLPLQARLQTPRFLIAGDTAQPSIAVVNRTNADASTRVSLQIEGDAAQLDEGAPTTQTVNVPAEGETLAKWRMHASAPGDLHLTGVAYSTSESDGMVLPLSVHEDGLQQHLAASARLMPDDRRATLNLDLPEPLDPARTSAHVEFASSPAVAALDALPYLIRFPYGCVEQTMSRFLPAIIVRDSLTRLGLDPGDIEARILTGETKADARRRHAAAGLGQLDEVTSQSVLRLTDAQLNNGGWGWWPDAPRDDPWMTAYVTWGLGLAIDAGVSVPPDVMANARNRCAAIATTMEIDADFRAWALHAATSHGAPPDQLDVPATIDALFAIRDELSPSARAVLALAIARTGTASQREIILRNLANQTVHEQSDLGTLVHWGSVRGHWNALHGAHEATALSVLALLALDPGHDLVQPAVAWLSLNRRSAHWDGTRATTFAVLALMRQLDAATPDAAATFDLRLNGRRFDRLDLSPASLLDQPRRVSLPPERLRGGANQIEIRRRDRDGETPVFVTALASTWATGESVKPASHVIRVDRAFDRQIAQPTVLGPTRFTAERQAGHGAVFAAEQVDARVALHVPHELHYLMIKIPRPAGCEPLNPLSGWDVNLRRQGEDNDSRRDWRQARVLYREQHDDHSAVFIDHLEPGDWEITLGLRAVTPGDYRALPAEAEAMYVPEITANSDARRLTIDNP